MNILKKLCNRYLKQLYILVREFLIVYSKLLKRTLYNLYVKIMVKDDKPDTIQLPITYKCNCDCIMCGMEKLKCKKDFSLDELELILSDKLFTEIKSVGLNGGEPFLINLIDYVHVIVNKLPKLKNIYVISNGSLPERILEMSEEIFLFCKKKGINYTLSISLDGINEMHDRMRGRHNLFDKTKETIIKINENSSKYCSNFGVICTITKLNVYNLAELDSWAKDNNIPISYNIATMHERLKNDYKFKDFSVFTDNHTRYLAQEFFYSKFLEDKSEKYFCLYYYVKNLKRISKCDHKKNVVTLTPNGYISYCATFSKELGNALKNSAYNIYFDKTNEDYKKNLHKDKCDGCSHYTSYCTESNYIKYYAKERMKIKRIYR